MLYISTLKTLAGIPAPEKNDSVVVFCKEDDSVKIKNIIPVLPFGSNAEFVYVEGKEDMLVCLGSILFQSEKCTYLDTSLPVPKKYADKIIITVEEKKPRKKRTRKAVKAAEPPVSADEANAFDENSGNMPMNPPEPVSPTKPAMPAEEKPAVKIDDPVAARLYNIIGVTSEDVGFSMDTEMLMLIVAEKIESSMDDDELRESVLQIHNGDVLWERMRPHLVVLKEAVKGIE